MPLGLPSGPWRTALRLGPAAAFLIVAAGCNRGDPLDSKVKASDENAFNMWRSGEVDAVSPEQCADIDKAVQEIRFQVIADGKASGSDAVQEATLQEIDGMTVRALLLRGLGFELKRAEFERSTLDNSMKINAKMRTRPGDTESADYLTDLRDRQLPRLQAATEEVERTKKKLAALAPVAAPSP